MLSRRKVFSRGIPDPRGNHVMNFVLTSDGKLQDVNAINMERCLGQLATCGIASKLLATCGIASWQWATCGCTLLKLLEVQFNSFHSLHATLLYIAIYSDTGTGAQEKFCVSLLYVVVGKDLSCTCPCKISAVRQILEGDVCKTSPCPVRSRDARRTSRGSFPYPKSGCELTPTLHAAQVTDRDVTCLS